MSTAQVALTGASMGFRGSDGALLPVLDGVDLAIGEQEFVALVGPSGCGKSTLLRAIAGLAELWSGRIDWSGQAPRGAGARSALVFQSPRLLPWRNVAQNVAFGLQAARVPRREAAERSAEVLQRVGLAEFAGAFPRQLSGGMQQRVNLARALAVDPDLILLDEPFAALDAQTRESMQSYLARIWQQGRKSALLVTHQVDEAVFLADRVVVLSRRPARIVADIAIDIPRPRRVQDKRSEIYREYEDRVWRALEPSLEPQIEGDL